MWRARVFWNFLFKLKNRQINITLSNARLFNQQGQHIFYTDVCSRLEVIFYIENENFYAIDAHILNYFFRYSLHRPQ